MCIILREALEALPTQKIKTRAEERQEKDKIILHEIIKSRHTALTMATKLPSGVLEIPYVRQSGNDGRTEHINLTDDISDTITLSKSSNKNSFYYFDKEEDAVQLDHSLKKSNIAITSSRIGSYIYLLDGTSTSILKNYSSFENYCPNLPLIHLRQVTTALHQKTSENI